MNDSYSAMYKSFTSQDPHSVGVQKTLLELYPALSRKIFESDNFMSKFVLSGLNAKDILDFPICGRCESIAALDGFAKKNNRYVNKCTCMKDGCGHSTIDPVTFRVWIMDELKKKHPTKDLAMLEMALSFAVDATAMAIKRKDEAMVARQVQKREEERRSAMVTEDGSNIQQNRLKIDVSFDPISDEEYQKQFEGKEVID